MCIITGNYFCWVKSCDISCLRKWFNDMVSSWATDPPIWSHVSQTLHQHTYSLFLWAFLSWNVSSCITDYNSNYILKLSNRLFCFFVFLIDAFCNNVIWVVCGHLIYWIWDFTCLYFLQLKALRQEVEIRMRNSVKSGQTVSREVLLLDIPLYW